jgi:peptide/nickel transport system permease protein
MTGFYVIDTILAMDWTSLGDVILHLVLPAFTMGMVLSGIFIRLTRANMLEVLKADHITAAEARGIRRRKIVYKYGLKNALVPILTMMGLQFALLIAGAVLCETTFSWPGLGRFLLESIYLRDYPSIQGVVVIFALIVATVSLMVDVVYALIDPRVRY